MKPSMRPSKAEVHQPLDSVVAEQRELVQHVDTPERHQNPRCSASQKEDAGFGEKVANQTFATGPCGQSVWPSPAFFAWHGRAGDWQCLRTQ